MRKLTRNLQIMSIFVRIWQIIPQIRREHPENLKNQGKTPKIPPNLKSADFPKKQRRSRTTFQRRSSDVSATFQRRFSDVFGGVFLTFGFFGENSPLCGGNGSFRVILCRFCVNLAILGVLGGFWPFSQENSRDSMEIRCFRGFSVFFFSEIAVFLDFLQFLACFQEFFH